jgi:hypothetical protein
MQHYELIHTEQYQGFDISFYATHEDMHPRDCFDDSITDIDELCNKIDNGDYVWFIAKVTASKNGIELASDYLGGCLYDNLMQFVTEDGYYNDMRQAVLSEAKKAIQQLTNEVTA